MTTTTCRIASMSSSNLVFSAAAAVDCALTKFVMQVIWDNGDNSEDDPREDSWNPTISNQNIPRFQRQRRSASLLEQSNQAPDEILILGRIDERRELVS